MLFISILQVRKWRHREVNTLPKSIVSEKDRARRRPRPPYTTELHPYPLGTLPLMPSSLLGWPGSSRSI